MKSPSFRSYILLSFVFHFLMVGTVFVVDKLTLPPPEKEAVSINFLSPEDLQKMAQADAAAKKKTFVPNNQVVEQSEVSSNEVVPENARFLSAKNQQVKKQTVAAARGDFQNLKSKEQARSQPQGDGKKKSSSPAEDTKKQIAKDLFKSFDATEALERQKIADKQSGLGEGRDSTEPNTGTATDASKTNDYVKDVDVGLETVLNTREFKYYSYYTRIRKQLSQHWEGRVRDKLSKLFREGRAPAATNQDRITKLMIVLNDKGTLVRVQILSDSGIRDLDDAAIEAFRAAAPFPNPPKGIVEGDGTVKIRWDFVLEV